jgi:hypothetical protein
MLGIWPVSIARRTALSRADLKSSMSLPFIAPHGPRLPPGRRASPLPNTYIQKKTSQAACETIAPATQVGNVPASTTYIRSTRSWPKQCAKGAKAVVLWQYPQPPRWCPKSVLSPISSILSPFLPHQGN